MKKAILYLSGGLIALSGLIGCENQSTPRGAVELAVQAIQHEDVSDLQKFLSAEARDHYANASGAHELKSQLATLDLQEQSLTITPTRSIRQGGVRIETFVAHADGTHGSVSANIVCRTHRATLPSTSQPGFSQRPVTQCTVAAIRL
jgi:hypothetical protein